MYVAVNKIFGANSTIWPEKIRHSDEQDEFNENPIDNHEEISSALLAEDEGVYSAAISNYN